MSSDDEQSIFTEPPILRKEDSMSHGATVNLGLIKQDIFCQYSYFEASVQTHEDPRVTAVAYRVGRLWLGE